MPAHRGEPPPPPSISAQTTPSAFSSEDFAQALEGYAYRFEPGQVVQGKVIELEPQGVYVDIGGKAPAFLPLAEAVLRGHDPATVFVAGSEHRFAIDRDRDGEIWLSMRRLAIEEAWEKAQQCLDHGEVVECRVTDANSGGVVVSFQGLRGFIPRSHLVDRGDLESLKGQRLPLVVLEIDREKKRLVLSHRKASQTSVLRQFQKGTLVSGPVSGLRTFGAFIDLGGTAGLLHIREITQKYVPNVEAVLKVGDVVTAAIVEVDESRGRIALSTKILELHPGEFLENREAVFAQAEERLAKNIAKLWDA
ncbi:MAG: S1 RNA-binding domain-containing protein [Oscillatoriales cyanobacterium SM2_1_8]|nr:S1 RNA-binding domain-containing protein [Oscillatoriales cyanobacterium SM2_1_8]